MSSVQSQVSQSIWCLPGFVTPSVACAARLTACVAFCQVSSTVVKAGSWMNLTRLVSFSHICHLLMHVALVHSSCCFSSISLHSFWVFDSILSFLDSIFTLKWFSSSYCSAFTSFTCEPKYMCQNPKDFRIMDKNTLCCVWIKNCDWIFISAIWIKKY